jgi:hypothetical protein
MIPLDVDALITKMKTAASFSGVTSVAGVTTPLLSSNHTEERPAPPVTPPHQSWCNRCNTPSTDTSGSIVVSPVTPPNERDTMMFAQGEVADAYSHQAPFPAPPPPYPGRPVGTPFRPGHQVWLYRWDDQTPRFAAPVTIVQMRTLWPGEQDIGWCDAAGAMTWHNARLAVAVET